MKLIEAMPLIKTGKRWRFLKEKDWNDINTPVYIFQIDHQVELSDETVPLTKAQIAEAFDQAVATKEPGRSSRSKIFQRMMNKLGFK